MTITNILVPVSGAPHDAMALATAFAAARPFDAHVTALFVSPITQDFVAASDWQMPAEVIQRINDARVQVADESKNYARQNFLASARGAGARLASMADVSGGLTTSWREEAGRLSQIMMSSSMFADLVVFPSSAGETDTEMHRAYIACLLRAERPVLLSPQSVPESVGRKIAVGWDGGMAASHALFAALPFLESSGQAELLCVRRGKRPEDDVEKARQYLSLHGVASTVRRIEPAARPIGEVLLDAATSCDLLVIGGYGHSRTLETIFGGVTEHIAAHATVPILMVH